MDRGNDGPLIDDFDFIAFDWRVNDSTAVSFGKLRRNPLTREDSISSNRILTIERSLITSRFFIDNVGGVFAVHERGDWAFGGGILSGSVDEDNLALPTLEGSLALKGNLGYRITDATELRLDYLYNPGDPDNNEIQPYRHVVSLNSYSRWNRFGLITDLIFADALPEAPGDLFSVVVLPHYMLTPRLQAVARYTWVSSSSVDGVRLARRYERAVSQLREGRGDRYQAWYAGLNYYIYGHKLKLMSGVEYTTLARPGSDYSGVTASAALRFYF
jgi:phosphate-selective porin OprO/OprP